MKIFRAKVNFLIAAFAIFSFNAAAQSDFPAFQLFREKKYEDAILSARKAISSKSGDIDDYVYLVRSLIALKRYGEAEYWAEKAQSFDRQDVRLVESRGEIHYFLGDNVGALGFFQQYVATASSVDERANSYFFMGDIYIRLQMFNHADISLALAVLYEPFNEMWWTRLGYAREMCRNYSGAYEAYEKILQINPQNAEAQSGRRRMESRIR